MLRLLARTSSALRPRAIPAEFFGMHITNAAATSIFADYDPSAAANYLQTPWPALPIGSVRQWDTDGGMWRNIMRPDGEHWERLDNWFDMVEAAGTGEVVLTLGCPPDAVTAPNFGQPTVDTVGWPPLPVDNHVGYNPHAPVNLDDWTEWCAKVATRYADRALIIWYEPWNEVNDSSHGVGAHGVGYVGSLERLLDLARTARETISAIDPKAKFLTPNFTAAGFTTAGAPVNLESYLAAGGALYADAVAIHPYGTFIPRRNPEQLLDAGRAVRAVLDRQGVTLPVWSSEWAMSDYVADDGSVQDCSQGAPAMAAGRGAGMLVRALLCSIAAGFARYHHYTLDWSKSAIQMVDPADPADLLAPATAWGYAATLLTGASFVSLALDGGAYRAEFRLPDGRTLLAYWMIDHRIYVGALDSIAIVMPAGVAQRLDLWGTAQTIGSSLTVTGNPQYLILEN